MDRYQTILSNNLNMHDITDRIFHSHSININYIIQSTKTLSTYYCIINYIFNNTHNKLILKYHNIYEFRFESLTWVDDMGLNTCDATSEIITWFIDLVEILIEMPISEFTYGVFDYV